jgi:hypothetical protein
MDGRVMACFGADGEFASDGRSRAAAAEWLALLIAEGKHWSEARREIAEYYSLSGMDSQLAHAKSKAAKPFLKPWLQPAVAPYARSSVTTSNALPV